MMTMALPLQTILDAELAAGNRIIEVTTWPPKCDLLVILARSFLTKSTLTDDLSFHQIDDSHFWKAELRYKGGCASACVPI
jgi:hypothetical protein